MVRSRFELRTTLLAAEKGHSSRRSRFGQQERKGNLRVIARRSRSAFCSADSLIKHPAGQMSCGVALRLVRVLKCSESKLDSSIPPSRRPRHPPSLLLHLHFQRHILLLQLLDSQRSRPRLTLPKLLERAPFARDQSTRDLAPRSTARRQFVSGKSTITLDSHGGRERTERGKTDFEVILEAKFRLAPAFLLALLSLRARSPGPRLSEKPPRPSAEVPRFRILVVLALERLENLERGHVLREFEEQLGAGKAGRRWRIQRRVCSQGRT